MRSLTDMVSGAIGVLTGRSRPEVKPKDTELGSGPAATFASDFPAPPPFSPSMVMNMGHASNDVPTPTLPMWNPMMWSPMNTGAPVMHALDNYTAYSHRTSQSGVQQTDFSSSGPMGYNNMSSKKETVLPNGTTVVQTTTTPAPPMMGFMPMYGYGMRPFPSSQFDLPQTLTTVHARDASGHLTTGYMDGDHAVVPSLYGETTRVNLKTLDFTVETPRTERDGYELMALRQTVHADGSMEIISGEKGVLERKTEANPLRLGESMQTIIPKAHIYDQVSIAADGSFDGRHIEQGFKDGKPGPLNESVISDIGQDLLVSRDAIKTSREVARQSELRLARRASDSAPHESVSRDGTTFFAYPDRGTIVAVDAKGESRPLGDGKVGGFISAPAVSDSGRTIYALGNDNKLYAYATEGSSEPKWSVDIKGTPMDVSLPTYETSHQTRNATADGSEATLVVSRPSVQVMTTVEGQPVLYRFDPVSGQQTESRLLSRA